MTKQKFKPMFWVLWAVLTVAFVVMLQGWVDRLYPFENSLIYVLLVAFLYAALIATKIGEKLKWVEKYYDPNPQVIYRSKPGDVLFFYFCVVVLCILLNIVIDSLVHRIPFFYTHIRKNEGGTFLLYSYILYSYILSWLIARKIAHKKGWLVAQPIETKTKTNTKEQS